MSSTRWVPTRLNSLASPRGHAVDRRQHEARGVEDRAQGADPGQVVVARAEVPEQRVGDVRVEDLDRPALPVDEQLRQSLDQAELGIGLEEGDGRRRRSRRRLEGDDLDLAALVRAVQREQERHDQGDGAEAADRGDGDDDPGRRPDRHDVAETEGQDRRGGEVERRCRDWAGRLQLVAQGVQDQAVADDQRRRARRAGGRSSRPARRARAAGRTIGPAGRSRSARRHTPRTAHEVSTDPEPARRRARDDDGLEEVPVGEC